MTDSREPPPHWPWSYRIEWRVMRLEEKVHGKKTTDEGGIRSWTPRDWMLAFAGLSMLLATLFEKIGWTTFGAFLVKLYGPK